MSVHISQIAGAAAALVGGAALGSVVTSAIGGGKRSTIISATKDYTLRQSSSGHLSVHRRTPKRRFHSRSSGGQSKLMETLILASILKK